MDDYKPILLKPLKDQMACIYASLLLHGDGDSPVEITSDKLMNILRAAKVDPNPFFPNLYSKVLQSTNMKDLILSGVGGSGGVVASGPVSTNAPVETKQEEKKEEPKKEEKEEESASIGGLFGSDDD